MIPFYLEGLPILYGYKSKDATQKNRVCKKAMTYEKY